MSRRTAILIITALALLVLGLNEYFSADLSDAPTSPALKATSTQPTPAIVRPAPSADIPSTTSSDRIDPGVQQLADELNAPESSIQRDLEVVREFLSLYSQAYGAGNPVGLNEDITAALTGTANPNDTRHLFPRRHNAIRNGQLIDRWGTPFWFHPESGTKMEIRSAGPDRNLFTADDVLLAK